MNFVAAKCPSCGADIQVDQNLETAYCSYCGSNIIVQNAIQRVKIIGPVELAGNIKTPNHAFESKLANANNWARLYFERGPGAVSYGSLKGYDAVRKYYSDAERLGANESKFYVDFSRFYVRANIEGIKNGYRYMKDKAQFINHYIFLMDSAILYADEAEKPFLIQEKQATLNMLNVELQNVREHKGGCYIATAIYGSYDCPQVWTLRRYRDTILANTWYGRAFIKLYYAVSPVIVKLFGNSNWFKGIWKPSLDKIVDKLNSDGFQNTPYNDMQW